MCTRTSGRRSALMGRLTLVVTLPLLVCTGCGKGDQPPGQPASGNAFEGHLEGADDKSIAGWAWDRNWPWPPTNVDIYEGDTLLATVPADKFRQDLLDTGIGSGQHAFVYATPAQLKDGKAHTIRAIAAGTNVELSGSPATVTLTSGPTAAQELPYEELVKRIQELVRTTLPPDATVLVVSKGDDDLLKLDGRKGWHFPRDEDGNYAGNPADSAEAIAHLERLRAKGAQFLLFPEPAFWWLDHYKEFKQHLETHYRLAARQEGVCIIYALGEAPPDKR